MPPTEHKLCVFDFNHIDPSLERDTVEMLKKFYAFYRKKHWGYDKLFRSFRRKDLVCNVVAGNAIFSSAVTGGQLPGTRLCLQL